MTELERVGSPTVGTGEWLAIQTQAEALAQSDIIPQAYRRKPANIIVAAITGRHFGWDVLTAMRNGHVIENQWAMKPEAMLGLVRQAGHSVTSEMSPDGATVVGKRADNGDTMTVTFTMADAQRAGLANRGTWKSYPQMMCYWRAIGMLCRLLFSDLTAGVHSTEELGGGDFEEADPPAPAAPLPLSDEAMAAFDKACVDNNVDKVAVLARTFPDGAPDVLLDSHLPAMRDAFKALVAEQADADIVEAEVVEDIAPVVEERPATRAMVGKIKGEYGRLNITDRDAQLDITAELVGHPVASHNHLTITEASKVLDELTALATPTS